MRASAATLWALLVWCVAGAAYARYCDRADVAWRAYRAPAAFEAQVLTRSGRRVSVRVVRVLRAQGLWPRPEQVLRLRLGPREPDSCRGRLEVPLRPRRSYVVFAERRGHAHSAQALGPPLKKTRKLLRRIHAVYAPGYIRQARVTPMKSVRVSPGGGVRLECKAAARPPPKFTWYKNGRPVSEIINNNNSKEKKLRVLTYRRRSVLVIKNAQRDDSASYECRAQGAIGPPAVTVANVSVVPPAPDPTAWSEPCPMPDPSSYCLNGGTCVYFRQVREPACKCPEGFQGQRCESKDVTNRSIQIDVPVDISLPSWN